MQGRKQIADLFDQTKWGVQFDRKEVDIISRFLSLHTYDPGQRIFKEGERHNYMAFIVSGHVDITKQTVDSSEKIVITLSPRTHFGEMSFVDEEPRSATARAKDKVTLLILSKDNFDIICEKHARIGVKMLMNIAKMISQRLRMTTGKLVYTGS